MNVESRTISHVQPCQQKDIIGIEKQNQIVAKRICIYFVRCESHQECVVNVPHTHVRAVRQQ